MRNVINTIPALLTAVAKKFAVKPAMLLKNGNKISYDDMMWDVSLTCRALKEQGITKSSKVALFMDNSPQCVESFLAITKMGAVAILVSYDFSENQIKEILEQEKPDAIFISDYKLSSVLGAQNTTILAIDDNRVLKQVSRQVKNSITQVSEKDNAVIMFDTTENGGLTKQVLTQKAFVEMTSQVKKSFVTESVNSIIDCVKDFIAPIFKGFAVCTTN
ncbi:MAG: acyl--CoA ligase [Treponema sp.]|uniref:AMP-binding protein n=1 Tax=Treponema sp. TaxID=166 RepID=UPI00298E88F8|nr:AMP-binding protein [Treponema sp.]MBR0155157.1 acyl--CoA ligase [Treponema sp.]MCR5386695.1 AMP-binding protein [Treponema sp.]